MDLPLLLQNWYPWAPPKTSLPIRDPCTESRLWFCLKCLCRVTIGALCGLLLVSPKQPSTRHRMCTREILNIHHRVSYRTLVGILLMSVNDIVTKALSHIIIYHVDFRIYLYVEVLTPIKPLVECQIIDKYFIFFYR